MREGMIRVSSHPQGTLPTFRAQKRNATQTTSKMIKTIPTAMGA